MNSKKKLVLLGLVAVVIGYSIVFGAIGGSGSNSIHDPITAQAQGVPLWN